MSPYAQYLREVREALRGLPLDVVHSAVEVLHQARINDRQVFIMGNGGSASTASHMACDLSKNSHLPGHPRFRVMALNDNMPLFSAYANDDGYANTFAEQLTNFVQADDVVIGISTSGNSPNVLRGIELSNEVGATSIGFTGFDGGQLARIADIALIVASSRVEQVEDVHLVLEHLITTALRRSLEAGTTRDVRAISISTISVAEPEPVADPLALASPGTSDEP